MPVVAADEEKDGIGVWLAFYTGMRRGEVHRCSWRDINWSTGRVVARRTKTGRRRVIPLASDLRGRLESVPEGRRKGRIVPWPAEKALWTYEAIRLLERLAVRCPDLGPELWGWNVFRHTFGTLLAQEGVSLDKISAWMGNSPAIARRHYVQFVPRGQADEEIEKL